GQTVILGGLISTNHNEQHHKVPWLGDLPLAGALFRYDGTSNEREELLIIMTPHIIKNDCDVESLKQVQAARMSWCISDVTALYGEAGLRKRCDNWSDGEVPTTYPDESPMAVPPVKGNGKPGTPELLPIPQPSQDPPGPNGPAARQDTGGPLVQPSPWPPDAPRGIVDPMAARQPWPPVPPQPPGVQPVIYNQPGPYPSAPPNTASDTWYRNP
ncbi:MAG: hypothetical protein ABR915_21075, partial [Thermoguttaceae bacterium]